MRNELSTPTHHLATVALDVADDPSGARFEDTSTDAVTPTDRLNVHDAMELILQAAELGLVRLILAALELRSEGLPHVHGATLASPGMARTR